MSVLAILVAASIYIAVGRWLVDHPIRGRDAVFALFNFAAVYLFFFSMDPRFTRVFILFFIGYVATVSFQYVVMRLCARRTGWWPWLAFLAPIAFLVFVRYVPIIYLSGFLGPRIRHLLEQHPEFTLNRVLIGISYLAFRTSYLVLEVRNGVVPTPDYWRYMSFAFFLPTLSVGPISPYSYHQRAFSGADPPRIPPQTAFLRMLIGAVKYRFFGPLLNQLTYSGLLLDGHPHHWIDLPIAAVIYYLYLYCNFSGFCDIAIGMAGLMRIEVAENFNSPFLARNLKDFWNRWHITLSHYMRDVVFNPLSKTLVRACGAARANEAIAVAILVVFLLIGVWHGIGWNYAAYGVAQGLGLVANHYWTTMLKRRLGKERFAAYNQNRLVRIGAMVLTFVYVTASLFLFANDGRAMKDVFMSLRA